MAEPSAPRFLESEFAQASPATARFHILPVPWEYSVSYGAGTARGPDAILAASSQLEAFDGQSSPGEDGIHTWPAVDCTGPPEMVFPRIREAIAAIYRAHAFPGRRGEAKRRGESERRGQFERPDHPKRPIPVILGGEHSLTATAVAGVASGAELTTAGGAAADLGVIQIDAHADLRDTYEGSSASHACVARRLHADLRTPLLQLGVRALSAEESIYRREAANQPGAPLLAFHDAEELIRSGRDHLRIPSEIPGQVYLTLDVDGLDPSVIPETGTPVPGGLGWYQTLALVSSIAGQREIVAVDVVELSPRPDSIVSAYATAELVYRIMGIISRAGAAGTGPDAYADHDCGRRPSRFEA